MRGIDADQMAAIADYPDLVEWLHESHLESVDAMDDLMLSQPAKDSGNDTLLVRAAWQRGKTVGVKLVTIFPGNAEGELPAVQAVYSLFDGGDGRPLASLDGTELTYWKTAADSALGTKLLARKDCQELLMVGAGALAPHLIRAHCAVRPSIRRVSIWNRTASKGESLAKADLIDDVAFESTADLEAAARRADIICCATASEVPLVLGEWLQAGSHLDLVGGYQPQMRETDAQALRRARVFVDARETTIGVCGDLSQPIENGEFSPDDVEGDLFDLCRHGLRRARSGEEITLFKNGGGGHLDLMCAGYFVARTAAPYAAPYAAH